MRVSPVRVARRRAGACAALAATLLAAACAHTATSAPAAASAPLPAWAARYSTEGRDLPLDQQARHALNRLTFGPRPGDYERVRALGVDRWIDAQLYPERIPDPAVDALAARTPELQRSGAELLAAYPPPGQQLVRQAVRQRLAAGSAGMRDSAARPPLVITAEDSARLRAAARESYRFVGELQAARMARAVASERQLQEVMVDFWENHFNVFAAKDRLRYYLPEYDATIRTHALGNFRDLLGAVAKSPAMLYYLDNWQSTADSAHATLAARGRSGPGMRRLAQRAPAFAAQLNKQLNARRPKGLNENYARELMELHTLGVDGGYTQRDVIEVARALTGWTIRPPQQGGGFLFRPEMHDADAKTILGQRFPAGRGEDEGERVLDLVAHRPSTARFIARKLCVRFVSDAPGDACVTRTADAFTRSNGDIRATLAVLLHSPEFFSREAYRAKVKTPFELVASTARALGAAPDTTPRTAQLVARLGQPLFGHQAPDGWPETGDAWMNTGAILNRINFGTAVAADRLPGAHLEQWPAYAALRTADRPAQIDGVVAAFLGGEASPDTRAVLLRGENPLAAQAARQAAAGADDEADGMSSARMPNGGAGMTSTMMAGAATGDRRAARQRRRADEDPSAAAREAVKPGRQLPPFAGAAPRLDPFAQLVGLALGAPEFQRR